MPKEKIPLTGVVKIPEAIAREIDMEASRRGLFKYEVVLDAWETYKRVLEGGGTEAVTHKRGDEQDTVLLLQSGAREWLDLLTRALRVTNPRLVKSLAGIQAHLGVIAEYADEEQGGSGISGAGGDSGTAEIGPRGGDPGRPATRRRREAG